MTREQILELADSMSNTTIIMPKNEDLIAFAEAIIQHHKDGVLKEVGEPFGWWHQGETDDESDFYLAESRAGEDCSACTQLFTSDQLIAARKGLEEEIERLKDQLEAAQEELSQADCLNGKIIAENGTLKEQLATAEQEDIIEMRADHLKLTEENHALREQLATAEQRVAEACSRTVYVQADQIKKLTAERDAALAELAKYRDAPVVAYATTNEEGDLSMLFFDEQEARQYSGDGEPIKLIVKPGE